MKRQKNINNIIYCFVFSINKGIKFGIEFLILKCTITESIILEVKYKITYIFRNVFEIDNSL